MDSGQLCPCVPYLDWQNLFSGSLVSLSFSEGHSDVHSQPEPGHANVSEVLIPAAVFHGHVILTPLLSYNQNAGIW